MRILYGVLILLMSAMPVFSVQGANAEDTLYVRGKAVVFYGPSKAEYLAMTDEQKDAIDEELYEFYHNRGEVSSFLASNGIQEISTGLVKIQVRLEGSQDITYLRRDFVRPVGLILTDSRQEPIILPGAIAVSDMIAEFEDFFSL
jgi:hypothetical protein